MVSPSNKTSAMNTGWSGGAYGVGERMSLKNTRAIIDGIHSGELAAAETTTEPVFGLSIPVSCTNCPSELLVPRQTWADGEQYDEMAAKLTELFHENFANYSDQASDAIKAAGPQLKNAGIES